MEETASTASDRDYLERMRRRINGQEPGVPGDMQLTHPHDLGDKSATQTFAAIIGVRTPQRFFEGSLADLQGFDFPDRCVVKPTFGSTSIGVHLLERRGGTLHDLVRSQDVTKADLLSALRAVEERFKVSPGTGTFIAEELLTDRRGITPPADVRCYMFQGECGLILVEDHITGTAEASYFNGDFSPMKDVHDRFGIHSGVTHLESIVDEPTPPAGAEALLAVARRVSIAAPTAFCRVDLYDTPEGPVLGEVTLYPGTFYYKNRKLMSDSEAERLGQMWGEAETRLNGSLLRPAPKAE